jgi:hypothetical protein
MHSKGLGTATPRRDLPPTLGGDQFSDGRGENEALLDQAAPAARLYDGDLTALFDLCLRTGAAS